MARAIVLDASAWLAVLLKEDNENLIEKILQENTLIAPELIRYEAANGILSAKRSVRTLHKSIPLQEILNLVQEFPIQEVPLRLWWQQGCKLVQHHVLTFYDAAYVACAQILQCPLLTLDKKIQYVLKEENLSCVNPGKSL